MPRNSSDDPIDLNKTDDEDDFTATDDVETDVSTESDDDDSAGDAEADAGAESGDAAEVTPAKPSGKARTAPGKASSAKAAAAKGVAKSSSARVGAVKSAAAPSASTSASKAGATSSSDISLTISKSMLKKAAAAVLVVALVVLIGVGVWQWVAKSRQLSAFDDVKSASEKYVTALISTLNSDQAANSKEILGPLSTGELRARLEKDRADTEKSVTDLKLKVTAKIYFSAVESFDNSEAKTVVLAEASGTSAQAPSGATNTMVLRLGLRHEDGKWLVSSVDGLPNNSSGKIDPNQSLPGTTAPASTPAG